MIYLLAFIIAMWAVLLALRFRLCWIHAAMVFLTSQLIGTYIFGVDYRNQFPTWTFVLGCLGFFTGLVASRVLVRELQVYEATMTDTARSRTLLWMYTGVTVFFITYHYAVGGIPLFQSDIMIARFDNTSSGLLGLPGRFNLFGGFFLYFLVTSYAQLTGSRRARRLVGVGFVVLAVSLLLGGSKGNLVQAAVATVVCAPFTTQYRRLNERLWQKVNGLQMWQMLVYGGLAIAGFCIVASIHIARGVHLYGSVTETLVKRTTEVAGQGYFMAVAKVVPEYGLGHGRYFVNDLRFFLNRFGIGGGTGYSTVQLVSATVTGRSLNGSLYIVPTTVNAFGYLFLEWGLAGVLFGSIVLGYLSGWLHLTTERTKHYFRRAWSYYAQMLMFWLLSKGNFGFYIPNMALIAVVFAGLLMLLNNLLFLVFSRTQPVASPRRNRPPAVNPRHHYCP